MNYFKTYLFTHLKLWWLYLIAILSTSVGLLFAILVVGRQLDEWSVMPVINLISTSLFAAIIGSFPVAYANHLVAQKSGGNVVAKTVINHIITVAVFYAIMHYFLDSLINFS